MSKKPEPKHKSKLTAKQRAFLAAFAELGHVTKAAESAKIARRTHYQALRRNPDYAEAFSQLREEVVGLLEDEAMRRATHGTRKKKFHQGEAVLDPETGEQYEELEYSDSILIFLLKANDPAKYRERHEVSGSVDVNHAGSITLSEIRQEVLRDERFIEYCRDRALDGDSGLNGQKGQQPQVDNGTPPGGTGSSTNGHRNGKH